jgi:predicted phosphodiesterase
MNSFNWLHISDFHQGQAGQQPLWSNIRQAFLDDLTQLVQTTGDIDVVLFTGDSVFSGQADQFTDFENELVTPLIDTLKSRNGKSPVFIAVPGNHDIKRTQNKFPSPALRQLLRDGGYKEIVDEFWNEDSNSYRELVNDSLENYSRWWNSSKNAQDLVFRTGVLPGDFSVRIPVESTFGELKIGIVGLNSTFLQLNGGDFHRRLALDVRQVSSICDDDPAMWSRSNHFNILLTHQGPDWYCPWVLDEVYPEINPAGRFDVHLFGHAHESVAHHMSHGGGPILRQWQSSSLFGMDYYGDDPKLKRMHGYSVGSAKFMDDGVQIRQWPREAFLDSNGWRMVRANGLLLEEHDGGTKPEMLLRPITSSKGNQKSRKTSNVQTTVGAKNTKWLYAQNDYRAYCTAIMNKFSRIRFVEIPDLQDMADVDIDDLFVEPSVGPSELHYDTREEFMDFGISLCDAIDDEDAIIFLGDPGCGKSTLIGSICNLLQIVPSRKNFMDGFLSR